MNINKLASIICRGTWLLDPRIADGFMPSIARFLNGDRVSWFEDDNEVIDDTLSAYCISADGSIISLNKPVAGVNVFEAAPVGSVVVIPISGTIMKEDYCGSIGTDTMSLWTKDAYAAVNVVAVIYKINSGGGSVEGTGEFAELVSQANKPVIAFCDGLMASAAYWIGSSAMEIWASYETVEIGSIGTAISFNDNRDAMAKYGYKQHYINADTSPDKNQDYFKALGGNYEPIKTNILNPTNDVFLNSVKKNRDGKLVLTDEKYTDGKTYQKPLTGGVYLAKTAIENGLIDRIGSFELAFARALEIGSDTTLNFTQKTNMLGFNKFSKLAALGKVAEGAITADQMIAANEEIVAEGIPGVTLCLDSELETIVAENKAATVTSASLVTANERVTALEAEKVTLTAEKANADAQIVSLTAELATANAKVIEYGGKPAASHTSGTKEGDDAFEGTDGKEDSFLCEADAELAELKAKTKVLPSNK